MLAWARAGAAEPPIASAPASSAPSVLRARVIGARRSRGAAGARARLRRGADGAVAVPGLRGRIRVHRVGARHRRRAPSRVGRARGRGPPRVLAGPRAASRWTLRPASGGTQGSDDGWIGDPRFFVRADRALGSAFRAGARLGVWLPGRAAPSIELAAATPELAAALTWAPRGSPLWLTANGGYRINRSARTATDAAQLSASDRLGLEMSSFDQTLLGLAAAYGAGRAQGFVELSAELMVGAGSPALSASPLRAGGGMRFAISRDVRLEALAEAAVGTRPTLSMAGPLVPVPPRAAVWLGVAYRFGAAAPPRARARAQRGAATRGRRGAASARPLHARGPCRRRRRRRVDRSAGDRPGAGRDGSRRRWTSARTAGSRFRARWARRSGSTRSRLATNRRPRRSRWRTTAGRRIDPDAAAPAAERTDPGADPVVQGRRRSRPRSRSSPATRRCTRRTADSRRMSRPARTTSPSRRRATRRSDGTSRSSRTASRC